MQMNTQQEGMHTAIEVCQDVVCYLKKKYNAAVESGDRAMADMYLSEMEGARECASAIERYINDKLCTRNDNLTTY
jgi:hypothetical protein